MPEQNGQHRTARAPKQRARKCASCTHSEVNRSRKGYRKQCPGAFGAIPASERIQFSEGRNANKSGSDCILADRGPGSEFSRALAACLDPEAGRGILPKDLIHPDMATQRPDGPRSAA